jgi:hypothetical protein
MVDQFILKINENDVGLRQTGETTFELKSVNVLDKLYGGALGTRNYFRVCLSLGDSQNVDDILSSVEEQMLHKKWILFATSSNLNVLEDVKRRETTAKEVFALESKYSDTIEDQEKYISKISEIYSKDFPYNIKIRKEKEEESKDHQIESFCFVATGELRQEAALLVKSLRMFHGQSIYIYCDDETEEFLFRLNLNLDDVFFVKEANPEILKKLKEKHFSDLFQGINDYHRPECILKKMECMNYALQYHNNTFFLDSDILVLNDLQERFDKDIFLSPHYHNMSKASDSREFGFFNAGYIFCADKTFPNFWREVYLKDSKFFEQEGMNYICEKYNVGFFGEEHNLGFWRNTIVLADEPVKSFHVHMFDNENLTKNKNLSPENEKIRNLAFRTLEESHEEILSFIKKMENGWGGSQQSFRHLESNPKGKINLSSQTVFDTHRSGWKYAVDALAPLHNKNGVIFDGFLENRFAWHLDEYREESKKIEYSRPWVGFLHNPPDMPPWFFYEYSLQNIIAGEEFQKSLKNCVGIFTLSENLAEYLRKVTGRKICSLIHPTEIPETLFDFNKFIENPNKKIVNIGYWLRKLNSIYSLPIEKTQGMNKLRLIPYSASKPMEVIDELTEKEKEIHSIEVEDSFLENTETKSSLSNEEYDELLSGNIVFLDLYDSSANNAVIECLARGTPLLVNPLPAVVEYLGEEYPLYFDSLEEAAEKALDFDLLRESNLYLLKHSTRKELSQEHFKKSFEQSEIYNLLR